MIHLDFKQWAKFVTCFIQTNVTKSFKKAKSVLNWLKRKYQKLGTLTKEQDKVIIMKVFFLCLNNVSHFLNNACVIFQMHIVYISDFSSQTGKTKNIYSKNFNYLHIFISLTKSRHTQNPLQSDCKWSFHIHKKNKMSFKDIVSPACIIWVPGSRSHSHPNTFFTVLAPPPSKYT